MTRRLLGPFGGPVLFFLVAALAFGGLGWVTVVALRVERAQREAAARAELESNLRIALRDLDSRLLQTLGVEDNRPFYHYAPSDPLSGSTSGPSPLLSAALPGWMTLHVQLDPAIGWDSPQVLSPQARAWVQAAWPDLQLRNDTPDRAAALKALRDRHPVRATGELLAARDRVIPSDAPPFAAPLFTTDPFQPSAEVVAQGPPPSPAKSQPPFDARPVSAPAVEPKPDALRLFGWEFRPGGLAAGNARPVAAQPPPGPAVVAQPPVPQVAQVTQGGARGNVRSAPPADESRGRDFNNRLQTVDRASKEAKAAGQDPFNGFNYQSLNPELRNSILPAPQTAPVPPGGSLPGGLPPSVAAWEQQFQKDGKADHEKLREDGKTKGDLQKKLEQNRQACLPEADDQLRKQAPDRPLVHAGWAVAAGCLCAAAPVPPGEERANPGHQGNANPLQLNNSAHVLAPLPVRNIHLGSLRPQWITAADGSETLILVRVAKLDNTTVYQGVVVDWPKLEQVLKEEVQERFPGAALVPVRDPDGVSPDRAMTALPVQLDPGPEPDLPAAGWTPLRLGLVLAWCAAFIALAAVGLSGWSLIDLAERRIRFVSAVTHELRTPLTSLRLYLDLLTSGLIHDEAKRQEYLATLAEESDRLHRLVDNVLDFAKLEKRRKNGDLKTVRVSELLEPLQKTWAERLHADGRELVVVSTLPPDQEVCTDPVMVQQIVGNLIDNARKYSREASDKRIWLWVRPDGARRVVFEVEDRGPGVPAGERKLIFKPFRRGAAADATGGGAGLGLALAKQWAEVLGGTVAYRPADGAPGACFRLELPSR